MIENSEELEKNESKKMLESFEMPVNWLGVKFVITAIPYTIDKICSNEKVIMNDLYKYVAKRHKTTASKVSCAIRYLLENTDISQKYQFHLLKHYCYGYFELLHNAHHTLLLYCLKMSR